MQTSLPLWPAPLRNSSPACCSSSSPIALAPRMRSARWSLCTMRQLSGSGGLLHCMLKALHAEGPCHAMTPCMSARPTRNESAHQLHRPARLMRLKALADEMQCQASTWHLVWCLYCNDSGPAGIGGPDVQDAGDQRTYRQLLADKACMDPLLARWAWCGFVWGRGTTLATQHLGTARSAANSCCSPEQPLKSSYDSLEPQHACLAVSKGPVGTTAPCAGWPTWWRGWSRLQPTS